MDTRQKKTETWKALRQVTNLTTRFWITESIQYIWNTHTYRYKYIHSCFYKWSQWKHCFSYWPHNQCHPWQGLISILSYAILSRELCRWWSTSEQTDDHQVLISTTPTPNYFNAFRNQSVASAKKNLLKIFYAFYLILPLSHAVLLNTTEDQHFSEREMGRKSKHISFYSTHQTHPVALPWNYQCAGQSVTQSLDWHLLNSGFVKQAVRTLRFWLQDFAGLQRLKCWSPSPVPVPNICPHAVPMQQRLSSVNIPVTGGRYSSSHPTCGKCPLVMKSSRAEHTH